MAILFVGANPGVLFVDQFGQPIRFVSVWMAEWTPYGSGTVVIVVDRNGWRTYGKDPQLASRLAAEFTRHFHEAEAFKWQGTTEHHSESIRIVLDPSKHLLATSKSVDLSIWDVLDMRRTIVDRFSLGDRIARLSNVFIPCGDATFREEGHRVVGSIEVEIANGVVSSTAYIAIAEVWETT